MTTPTTPISLLDIQNEFGGANPISMSEYYLGAGGGYVPAAQSYGGGYGSISGSGTIDMYSFRNKQKFVGGAIGFTIVGTLGWVVPSYVQAINIRAMGAGGGGGGGSARAGRESQQEAVGGGGGGGSGTVYQSTVSVTPGSTIYVVIGGGGSGGGGRDGTYSAGSSGGAGGHSGVLNSTQSAWHCLSYGGGGGTVGQDNAQAARGVRGADRAAGTSSIYNYGWNSGYGTVGKNDRVVTGSTGGKIDTPIYGYNCTGGVGAQGYSIWGDSTGTTGQGGGFYNGNVVSDYGTTTYVYPTAANSYGGGGGGGAGADRNGYSGINGAAGTQGGVVIWW